MEFYCLKKLGLGRFSVEKIWHVLDFVEQITERNHFELKR